MTTQLSPEFYELLINEDIEWLKEHTSEDLEQKHIIKVLNQSIKDYKKERNKNELDG